MVSISVQIKFGLLHHTIRHNELAFFLMLCNIHVRIRYMYKTLKQIKQENPGRSGVEAKELPNLNNSSICLEVVCIRFSSAVNFAHTHN